MTFYHPSKVTTSNKDAHAEILRPLVAARKVQGDWTWEMEISSLGVKQIVWGCDRRR